MESKGKVRRLLFLTAILTMLMAGCTYAASLSSRTYTLSPRGYIAWSDFSVPSSETVKHLFFHREQGGTDAENA